MKAIAYKDENGNDYIPNMPYIKIPPRNHEEIMKELSDAGMKDVTLFDCPPYPDVEVTWDVVKERLL